MAKITDDLKTPGIDFGNGDLANTNRNSVWNASKLFDIPLTPGTPLEGQTYFYDTGTATYVLGSPPTTTDATSLQGQPIDPTIPISGDSLVFNGTSYIPTPQDTLNNVGTGSQWLTNPGTQSNYTFRGFEVDGTTLDVNTIDSGNTYVFSAQNTVPQWAAKSAPVGTLGPLPFDTVSTPTPGDVATLNATGDGIEFLTPSSPGMGTVTSVSVTTANGISGMVATATTTPAITLNLGSITPTSVAATGTMSGSNLTGINTGDQTINLIGDVTGTGTGTIPTTVPVNSITYPKIQQVSANSILGNSTGSTANVSEIPISNLPALIPGNVYTIGTNAVPVTLNGASSGDLQSITVPSGKITSVGDMLNIFNSGSMAIAGGSASFNLILSGVTIYTSGIQNISFSLNIRVTVANISNPALATIFVDSVILTNGVVPSSIIQTSFTNVDLSSSFVIKTNKTVIAGGTNVTSRILQVVKS